MATKKECSNCHAKVDYLNVEGKVAVVDPKQIVTFSDKGEKQKGFLLHRVTCAKANGKKAPKKKAPKATDPETATKPQGLAAEA